MVTYEVNLNINADVYSDFYVWLLAHIKQMLLLPGFIKAELAAEEVVNLEQYQLTVRYLLKDRASLEHYFSQHASAMREEGIKRFGENFSASRRIFRLLEEF